MSSAFTPFTEPLLLSVPEAARRLRLSQVTIYELAKRGKLRLVRFGSRCTRIPLEDVLRLAETGASTVSGEKKVAA